jgi:hypothetical protein
MGDQSFRLGQHRDNETPSVASCSLCVTASITHRNHIPIAEALLMAGFTTPPLTQPTTGHTGQGDGAPAGTDTERNGTVYDDPGFAAFFLEYCQGRYEVPYRSATGI